MLTTFLSAPMSYWSTHGPAVDPITRLGWGLTLISLAVILIIAVLLCLGMMRRRPQSEDDGRGMPRIQFPARGIEWIYIGAGTTFIVLIASATWTFHTIAAVAAPPDTAALSIEIYARQWWWEVRYTDPASVNDTFTTANEIHIPVGQPIRFELKSPDVIHSFWIPKLAGKTDVIPGQTNVSWMQADAAGTYRGQCAEYCGVQHAHMALLVIAETHEAFEAWRTAQRRPGPALANELQKAGHEVFLARCSVCHSVRGTQAHGSVGPDLTHLMSRQTIAAGTLPNQPGPLGAWIVSAQTIKPGSRMPNILMPGSELQQVVAYLGTLH